MPEDPAEIPAPHWLVLLYQFPKGPGARRVKIWRRLQNIGAVAIKNSVYVLPWNDQAQEDFHWLLTELRGSGAEGAILEARFINGMTDDEVRALFNTARNADYQALCDQIEAGIDALPADADAVAGQQSLARARGRFAEIEAIDFFGADGHDAAEGALRNLSRAVTPDEGTTGDVTMPAIELQGLTERTWVTRRNVRVDRIASAWLIRRWIDPGARFKFVSERGYEPRNREIRFDMFEAEFTHEDDACTFEVLARLVRPDDGALGSIAEIVHDIDLKDSKFGRAETDGVASTLSGIVASTADDDERLARGGQLFEDLYRFFDTQTS
jgi:hypothetical protein